MDRRRFMQRALVAPSFLLGTWMPAVAQIADPPVRRLLRFTLTFVNPLNSALENQRFWCYLPASATSSQRLRGVRVSMAHRLHDDALGHRILELSFDRFPALGQKIVTVTAEVELDARVQPLILSDPSAWLAAERFIESDHPHIRKLASELRRATNTDTAFAIYEWVRDNTTYAGYLAEDLGALHAMLNRSGDCTEFSNLVVALARANGIAARMVGGYVVDRDLAPLARDYHNWAEIYLEGGWRLIDAQKQNWLEPSNQYVTFRIYRDVPINPVGLSHRYRLAGDLQLTF